MLLCFHRLTWVVTELLSKLQIVSAALGDIQSSVVTGETSLYHVIVISCNSMANWMRNKCTTNYCNRTNLVQVIVEDVMTFLRHSVRSVITLTHLLFIFIWGQWFLLVQPSATLVSNSYEFLHNFYSLVENDDWFAAQLLAEILYIRDDDFRVLFNDGERLSSSELYTIYSCALILYRRRRFINHLLTYLLTYCHMLHRVVVDSQFISPRDRV